MGKCAAGNELPTRGPCKTCGASSNEPCPEALRIASEERHELLTAATALVEEIASRGTHEGWKRLANLVAKLNGPVGSPSRPEVKP
jgi:hypothetical protein